MKYDDIFDDPKRNITGKIFGRLRVVSPVICFSGLMWVCECSCGSIKKVQSKRLMSGNTQSCGCLKKDMDSVRTRSHGLSRTKLYKRWKAMIRRCSCPNDTHYKDYGGRGISVCEEWKSSFSAFYGDMGPTFDPKLKLDRRDNNGNYCKDNCRWVTQRVNCHNKRNSVRVMHDGRIYCVTDLSKILGIPESTIYGAYPRADYCTGDKKHESPD